MIPPTTPPQPRRGSVSSRRQLQPPPMLDLSPTTPSSAKLGKSPMRKCSRTPRTSLMASPKGLITPEYTPHRSSKKKAIDSVDLPVVERDLKSVSRVLFPVGTQAKNGRAGRSQRFSAFPNFNQELPKTPGNQVITFQDAKRMHNPTAPGFFMDEEDEESITPIKLTNPFLSSSREQKKSVQLPRDTIEYVNQRTGEKLIRKLTLEEQMEFKPRRLFEEEIQNQGPKKVEKGSFEIFTD